jgi:hypothetical protein
MGRMCRPLELVLAGWCSVQPSRPKIEDEDDAEDENDYSPLGSDVSR